MSIIDGPSEDALVDSAPDFVEGYPSRGKLIGPAWEAAWEALNDGQWHTRSTVAKLMAEQVNIKTKTAMNLLRKAARAGLILQRGGRHIEVKKQPTSERPGNLEGTQKELGGN
jgi:hypothetical protein